MEAADPQNPAPLSHPNCMIAPGGRTMIEQWSRDRVSQLTEALAYWIAQDTAR